MQATARQVEDKECYSYTTNGSANGRPHRKNPAASRLKPMPSKWDDAQKWLVGMSNGGGDGMHGGKAAKPRNSNADDRRLLSSSSQNGRISCSSVDGGIEYNMVAAPPTPPQLGEDDVGETKNMDCMVRPHGHDHGSPVSVCLRDMGTEMTPIASKEPSRAATPLRSTTPVARSPIPSRSSTPGRRRQDAPPADVLGSDVVRTAEQAAVSNAVSGGEADRDSNGGAVGGAPRANTLESRAAAWDEAERAKFMARCERIDYIFLLLSDRKSSALCADLLASSLNQFIDRYIFPGLCGFRYKREEVKIQAWENHEKRKAEMEMKKIEVHF